MSGDILLPELAKKLRAVKRRGLATQLEIERVTGVNQATISRVLNGQRHHVTERIVRLDKYVNMLLQGHKLSTEIQEAARDFLGLGGSEAELVASIEHSAKLVSGRLL